MAQGPASAASSEQPKGCAIGPQLSGHALRKRREASSWRAGRRAASVGQGGAAAGRQNSRRADAWLALRREHWVCYQRRSCPRPPRLRPAAAEAAAEAAARLDQPVSVCCWTVEGWGWRRRRWWSWSGRTPQVPPSTHLADPPPWRRTSIPLAPLPTAPVFTVPPDEKCRAAAAAARPGSVIKRPGSGDEMFGRGRMDHRAARRTGPQQDPLVTKARNRRSALGGTWEH